MNKLNLLKTITTAITVFSLSQTFASESPTQAQNFTGIGAVLSSSKSGVIISDLYPDGPAATADIQKNDIILKVNDISVKNASEAKAQITASTDELALDILRGNDTLGYDVKKSLFALGKASDFNLDEINAGVYVRGRYLVPFDKCSINCEKLPYWQEIQVVVDQSPESEVQIQDPSIPHKCQEDENKICLDADEASQAIIYIGDLAGRTRGVFSYEIQVGQNIITPPSGFVANSDDGEYVFVRLPSGTFMF